VGVDELKTEVIALLNGITPRGPWASLATYIRGDFVTQAGGSYFCVIPHTAGVFATDLAAGKWMALSSLTTADARRLHACWQPRRDRRAGRRSTSWTPRNRRLTPR
jgi:hypothetical protein